MMMKKLSFTGPTIAAAVLAAGMTVASPVAQAEFTGDVLLACQALLCLPSPTRPGECAPSISHYFGIVRKKASDTANARRQFLELCPTGGATGVTTIIDQIIGNTGTKDEQGNEIVFPDDKTDPDDSPTPPVTGGGGFVAMTPMQQALNAAFAAHSPSMVACLDQKNQGNCKNLVEGMVTWLHNYINLHYPPGSPENAYAMSQLAQGVDKFNAAMVPYNAAIGCTGRTAYAGSSCAVLWNQAADSLGMLIVIAIR